METAQLTDNSQNVLTAEQIFAHWQGHRNLTRKTIEVFPENEFFNHTIGGMRIFAGQVMEIIDLTQGITGLATDKWADMESLAHSTGNYPKTKEEILKLWDETTTLLNQYAPQISPARFNENILAFGAYPGTVCSTILYFIDNEIHHRAQGFVLLRSLGITPPAFWDRN